MKRLQKLIKQNRDIILYKMLNKYFDGSIIIITNFDVKQVFVNYSLIPNLCPHIRYKCSYSVGKITTKNSGISTVGHLHDYTDV